MSETTELVVIERASALEVFTSPTKIDELLQDIERQARSFVPDLSTGTSRKAIASIANKVARSKTYIDAIGKDVVADLKKLPAQIDEQRRLVRERLDLLKDEVRKPLTDWEVEQERIAAEKAAEEERLRIEAEQAAAVEALKKQIEADHELALLMNIQFDRDAADAIAEAERQRIAHEEEIKRQAAEQARIETEQKAQQERDAAAQREAELRAKAEQAERDRIAAEEKAERDRVETARKAEQDRIDAAKKAESDRLAAAQQAEREKQEAIAAEQLKAKQKEDARLAEEKRLKDEADKRAADVAHRKTIGTAVVNALTEHAGLTREQAIETLKALMDNKIPHTSIQY